MEKKKKAQTTTQYSPPGKAKGKVILWTLAEWELRPHSGQEDSARVHLEGKADLEPGTFTLTRRGFHITGVRVPFIPITSRGVPSGVETPSR